MAGNNDVERTFNVSDAQTHDVSVDRALLPLLQIIRLEPLNSDTFRINLSSQNVSSRHE